jgi:iron complex outermembrane recepter protein
VKIAISRLSSGFIQALLASSLALPVTAQNSTSAQGDSADQGVDNSKLEEVVVTGLRQSLESSRAMKRNGDAITDSIVAQDIGKLPDQNIAEAAQRIPGVQIQYYNNEGASIAVRGLSQTKVVLDGLEVFGSSAHAGEYNGRNFDLEDLPAELLAGIDVNKSSSANEIEGGLGGYVNIRTRKPFDFSGLQAVVSAKATDFKMAPGFGSKVEPQLSALLSDRWDTPFGDMGLLVNAAYTKSAYGTAEDEVQRTQEVTNYAGSGTNVVLPIGMFTGNGHNGDRRQEAFVAAFQWKPNDATMVHANFYDFDYRLTGSFQTARFYVGNPTSDFSLWDGANADGSRNLKSGAFTDNTLTDASVIGDEGRVTHLAVLGANWNNGPLTLDAEVSRNNTSVVNTLYEWGIDAKVPGLNLTMNQGAPSTIAISGVDLTNKANFFPDYLLAIHLDGTQTNTAAHFDGNYNFGDGLARSVDFGLRYSDYTRRSYGFVDFDCIDGCSDSTSLAGADPALLTLVPGTQSRDVGPYWTFASSAVRGQTALRQLYGLPASEAEQTSQYQLNNEKALAAYIKLNWGFEVLGRPVTGNIGGREVQTRLDGQAYGTDPVTGDAVLQGRSSTRYNFLPSFNGKLGLTDGLFLRLGASKTLGQVNFQYLSTATVISNPVQRDAQQGNPNLKPYTSTNYDLSLEDYFGKSGLVYLGLFHKRVDGFVQTVAVQEQINGETYNVSTYQSSGLSTIRGVEVGLQKFFDGLPRPFDGLGIQANYTYVDSQAPSPVAGQTVPLQGLSKNSYNLVGMYERNRISARLAYNYRSSYLVSTSSSGAQGVPIVAASLGTLDFSVAYNVTDHLSFVVDGVNILNANTEQYYGNPHNQMNYLPLNSRYGLQAKYVF